MEANEMLAEVFGEVEVRIYGYRPSDVEKYPAVFAALKVDEPASEPDDDGWTMAELLKLWGPHKWHGVDDVEKQITAVTAVLEERKESFLGQLDELLIVTSNILAGETDADEFGRLILANELVELMLHKGALALLRKDFEEERQERIQELLPLIRNVVAS